MTAPNGRLTPERLARIRQLAAAGHTCLAPALRETLAELDAVTRERDDFLAELVKCGAEVDTLNRERDDARKDTARLDWLQNDQGRTIYQTAAFEGKPWACGERAYSELRTAIDDGMSWPEPGVSR